MKKKVIVDTNAFLRFLLNDIPEHKKEFERLLQKAKKSHIELVVPQIIIFEIHFILDSYYHFSKEEVIEKLKSLLAANYLFVESREVFDKALTLYSTQTLSLADCFLLATAEIEHAELFTFDKKLKSNT